MSGDTPPPCPYGTGDGIACTAGALGHKAPHVYPGADPGCWVYRRSVGVPPTRCTVIPDHHEGPHEFDRP